MQTLYRLSQKPHYCKYFDFIFLALTEALWVTEKDQMKQHTRQFSYPKGPLWPCPQEQSLEVSLQGFSILLPAPLVSPTFLLPPSSFLLFLCRVFELCSSFEPIFAWRFCRPTLSKELNQTKACPSAETSPRKQFTYSLLLPDFAPWGLTSHSLYFLQISCPSQGELYQQLRE